ncbi:MAG: hypothetical protein JSV84_07985 [Gemmatimonadota bacterium]|nr:MAG: hypothetical protein JSV84_07985 [Gemmatimonadota bacterium]
MMTKRADLLRFGLMLCVGAMILIGGCSHESDDIPTKITTSNSLMKEAWDDYRGGDFSSSITKFRQVLNRDATITEAYVGLGWAYTLAGTFDKALNNFIFTRSRPDWSLWKLHVNAGTATNYAASGNDSLAVIYAADSTLHFDPDWKFYGDSTITFYDLHVLIAQVSFKSKRYIEAMEKVDELVPNHDWSTQFSTQDATETVESPEVSTDSTWAILEMRHTGVNEVLSVESAAAVASVPASKTGNIGGGSISEIGVSDEETLTEYWTVTCDTTEESGGKFSVVGSETGLLGIYDIKTGRFDGGKVTFTIRDGRPDFSLGDTYTFATTAAHTPLTVDQVKDGNRIFVKGTKFFSEVDYEIVVEYKYFDDFGYFVLNLMEKINELF